MRSLPEKLHALFFLAAVSTSAGALSGCGYTKEEYQLQGDKLTRAVAKERAAETRADEASAELDAAKQRVSELEDRMRSLGIDLETRDVRPADLAATLAERERALAEFRARSARVEETKARVSLLRAKLAGLDGVEVVVRKNRLVIAITADSFEGKDKLSKAGKAALGAVAEAIKSEPVLAVRDYQVAGHVASGGPKANAADELASSVAAARAVFGFLADAKAGGLDRSHLSVAGYGGSDPLAANDSDEGKKKNRRCEIVLVPTPGELIDLRAIGAEPPAAKVPETKPADPKPAEKKPEAKPAEKKPEAKPAETKPAETKPAPKKTDAKAAPKDTKAPAPVEKAPSPKK